MMMYLNLLRVLVCKSSFISTLLFPLSLGCQIEYLSPYSPDLNPVEQAFSVIKAHLRHQGLSFYHEKSLYTELYEACLCITPEMTWGSFNTQDTMLVDTWQGGIRVLFMNHNVLLDTRQIQQVWISTIHWHQQKDSEMGEFMRKTV